MSKLIAILFALFSLLMPLTGSQPDGGLPDDLPLSETILLSINYPGEGYGTPAMCADAEVYLYTDGTIRITVPAEFAPASSGNAAADILPDEGEVTIATLQMSQHNYDRVAAFASPELTAEDYLSLPRQCCLPMGMVLSGYWPVGIARHGLNLVKANEAFFSPKGEGFWGRNYGRNLWLYPAWPLDLSDHRQELEAAGYAFFARMEETLPPNMPNVRRTSDFNWDGALL